MGGKTKTHALMQNDRAHHASALASTLSVGAIELVHIRICCS